MNLLLRLLWLRVSAGRRGPLGMWETGRLRLRVLPTDLDLLGHVNNGRYLSLMDLGRLDLLTRNGLWAKARHRGWMPVVAGQTITYRRSLQPWQRFELSSRAIGFDRRWCYVEQVFTAGSQVCAHAVVRVRFLRRGGGSVDADQVAALAGGAPEDLVLPAWVGAWTSETSKVVRPERDLV